MNQQKPRVTTRSNRREFLLAAVGVLASLTIPEEIEARRTLPQEATAIPDPPFGQADFSSHYGPSTAHGHAPVCGWDTSVDWDTSADCGSLGHVVIFRGHSLTDGQAFRIVSERGTHKLYGYDEERGFVLLEECIARAMPRKGWGSTVALGALPVARQDIHPAKDIHATQDIHSHPTLELHEAFKKAWCEIPASDTVASLPVEKAQRRANWYRGGVA